MNPRGAGGARSITRTQRARSGLSTPPGEAVLLPARCRGATARGCEPAASSLLHPALVFPGGRGGTTPGRANPWCRERVRRTRGQVPASAWLQAGKGIHRVKMLWEHLWHAASKGMQMLPANGKSKRWMSVWLSRECGRDKIIQLNVRGCHGNPVTFQLGMT